MKKQKKEPSKRIPAGSIDARFNEVVCLVEADDFTRMALWKDYAWRTYATGISPLPSRPPHKLIWEDDTSGLWQCINQASSRPINLCFIFARIEGQLVCFWDPISELVDYKIIKEWLAHNFPNVDQTNAMNFHCAVSTIRDANEKCKKPS